MASWELGRDDPRPRDGGKGFDGVYEKAPGYYNPVEAYLKKKLKVGK